MAFSGIKHIDLIDLDTIDVSNLNRQFLFRPEHVGRSKAHVAAKASLSFNPDLQINAYHDNIKSAKFNVNYFSNFDIVLNGLDNVDARRHVNRLCLAANVPLIDSGTTGYLGQVTPIIKGVTACYECFPKPTQKVYPVCTIRSTPDKPIHCIVWAKEAFKLLFGNVNESMLFEDTINSGDKSTYMHLITPPTQVATAGESTQEAFLSYAQQLLLGLYTYDTQKRIDMEVYKTAKSVPVPLSAEVIADALEQVRQHTGKPSPQVTGTDWDHGVWTLVENVAEFINCLFEAFFNPTTPWVPGSGIFDKDDLWSMRFVTAASNIRSSIFLIPLLSFYDAKGVAGNIIPAIATTNANIAGIQVQSAISLLLHPATAKAALLDANTTSEQRSSLFRLVRSLSPQSYCLRMPTRRGHLLEPAEPEPPVATCYVCHPSQLSLLIDTAATTLQTFVDLVLKLRLGFAEPNLFLGSDILYEEGADCDEDLKRNLALALNQCPAGGIKDQVVVTVEDFSQKLQVRGNLGFWGFGFLGIWVATIGR